MGHSTNEFDASRDAPSAFPPGYCPECGKRADPTWEYCAFCGAAAPALSEERRAADLRRRLGMPPRHDAHLFGAGDHSDIVYPNGMTAADVAAAAAPHKRRRKKRRPLWRRPLLLVPMMIMIVLVSAVGATVYRANGVLNTLQTISTPPPEITDSTYMQEPDPDMPQGPITVNTGPARTAIQEASAARNLPKPQNTGGIGQSLRNIPSGVGDIANAASVATGIGSGGAEGFTVLVMGVDAAPGAAIDIGVRPDVMMLIRFEPETQSCRMLSIPRDTRVELPGYGESKINHALMVGGIPYQLMVTEDFIDQPIDHYLLIDFQAFQQAVDVVGGVDVTVDKDLRKDGPPGYTAGDYQFDGEEALAFARFRTPGTNGDIGRVERQWSILGGLADAAQGRDLISDVNTLVPTVEEHIRTDMTLTEMATIARDYGNSCLNIDRESIDMIEGSRVKFEDPIMDMSLYFNVVNDSTVENRIDELINGKQTPATPARRDSATPSASPDAATPQSRVDPPDAWASSPGRVGAGTQ